MREGRETKIRIQITTGQFIYARDNCFVSRLMGLLARDAASGMYVHVRVVFFCRRDGEDCQHAYRQPMGGTFCMLKSLIDYSSQVQLFALPVMSRGHTGRLSDKRLSQKLHAHCCHSRRGVGEVVGRVAWWEGGCCCCCTSLTARELCENVSGASNAHAHWRDRANKIRRIADGATWNDVLGAMNCIVHEEQTNS
jgi:hypothetical protein